MGQVDKKATQQDLTNLFEEFGQIESINVSRPLPPLPSNLVAVCSFDLLTRNVTTAPQPVITVAVPNDLSCLSFFHQTHKSVSILRCALLLSLTSPVLVSLCR